MKQRTWIPEAYLDEITPPGRPSPDAWLTRLPDGQICIAKAWDFAEEGNEPIKLEIGQTVGFYWCDELGEVKVQFKDDGTFAALGPVDAAATHFWAAGDPGSLAASLEEMSKFEAAQIKQTKVDGQESEYSICDVQTATWAEKAVYYRLVVERGAARFLQVAGAN